MERPFPGDLVRIGLLAPHVGVCLEIHNDQSYRNHTPHPVLTGIKYVNAFAIYADSITVSHLGDPLLSSIKAQAAHGAMSQEEVTRVTGRRRKRGRQTGESSLRISSFSRL